MHFRTQMICRRNSCLLVMGLIAVSFIPAASAFHTITSSALFLKQSKRQKQKQPLSQLRMTKLEGKETPPEIEALQESLAYVRDLPRSFTSTPYTTPLLTTIEPLDTPTYRRLFTHDTWKMHLGGSFLTRWRRCMFSTASSVIVKAVWKSVLFYSLYALAVSLYLPDQLAQKIAEQQLPLSLCGNAIGLLLVFRTNNAYNRLEEAREMWGRVVYLAREIVANTAAGWTITPRKDRKHSRVPTKVVVAVCRYLAAFVWSLRDELRDGDTGGDILYTLLPEAEAKWVTSQRSRPMAIHGRLRRLLYDNQGLLAADHIHLMLENDLKDLALVSATCERIFTSPVPVEMSRHGLRSVTLFLLALPVVLVGSLPPAMNVAWSAVMSFVYLGIDELGVQVEQPFQLIPLWQLCRNVQADIEELVLHPLELEGNTTAKVDTALLENLTIVEE